MIQDALKAKLSVLPLEPGCYLMKDKSGTIIYVGKAKRLKNRVNQYFVGAHEYKVQKMVSNIVDFDYIVTNSEKEALLLEINLIKKHRPRYNIMFMDDKTYPYIRLTKEEYPRLSIVREGKRDWKSDYFGPYPDASSARKTVDILNKLFPLRKCLKLPKKVCLYYHMGQCLGPCEFTIDPKEYQGIRNDVIKVLRGDTKNLIKQQQQKMDQAMENLEYEKAKDYHENIQALEHISDKQRVQVNSNLDQDSFHYYCDKGYFSIQILLVRNGKLLERTSSLEPLYEEEEEAFISFVGQYYATHPLPDEILLPKEMDISSLPEDVLEKAHQPIRGNKLKLLMMARNNAKKHLEEKFLVMEKLESEQEEANQQLSEIVGTEVHRVEVFDNSHISGAFAVSGMVVFVDGQPSKKDYRLFQLHQGNNDSESMKEVTYRRYFRVVKDQLIPPDLILVDGGWIQIQAAKEMLDSLNVSIPIYGLVKDDRHRTSNLMNVEGEIVDVKRDSALFFLLTRMQDEVHRFAISYHQKLRKKAQTKSILDEIPGVGAHRKKKLLKHFETFKRLKEASVEDIAGVVPIDVAETIYQYLHSEE